MKPKVNPPILVFVAAIFFSFALSSAAQTTNSNSKTANPDGTVQAQEKPAVQEAKDLYTCPMHANVLKDKPGICPTCKMDLVKKDTKKVTYTCPMHANVLKDKPGICPTCKMDLVEKKENKEVPK